MIRRLGDTGHDRSNYRPPSINQAERSTRPRLSRRGLSLQDRTAKRLICRTCISASTPPNTGVRTEAVALDRLQHEFNRCVHWQIAQTEPVALHQACNRWQLTRRCFAGPDEPVSFRRRKRPVADRTGGSIGRVRRYVGAAGRPIRIAPAVVLALEFAPVVETRSTAAPRGVSNDSPRR